MFVKDKIDIDTISSVSYGLQNDTIGLAGSTLLETPDGWVAASDIAAGAEIETFDGGLATVVRAEVVRLENAPLIHMPGGTFDTCEDLWLLPHQRVMVDFACVEPLFDRPCVLIEARALVGHFGVTRAIPTKSLSLTRITFADEELVYANTGAVLHCPGDRAFGDDFYLKLTTRETTELMDSLTAVPRLLAAQTQVA